MAELKDRVQNALDEARMLILASQVLVGFQFRAVLEPGFEKLPHHTQGLILCGLGLMLIAIALLMWPAAFHRIVEEGEDTEELHSFTSGVMDWALLPFAMAIGIEMFMAAEKVVGRAAGVASGVASFLVALFFWYGFEFIRRSKREPRIKEEQDMEEQKGEQDSGGSKVTDKIKHVLTEARMVLPGAQALLGFQLTIMLMESFDRLPQSSKYVHLASLSMIALAVILLMSPAAYHRIVEEGEETEHFHRLGSRFLLASMVPLALGMCGDFFLVTRKVTDSTAFALAASATLLALIYGLWFGFTLAHKAQHRQQSHSKPVHAGQPSAD